MKKIVASTFFSLGLLSLPALLLADAVPGLPAPAFATKDAEGKIRKLSDESGHWVVLEWFNPDCPYVHKHYDAGNMQKLQKTYTDKKVSWYTIDSSAPGKQGHLTAAQALKVMKEKKSAASHFLLDPDGTIGRAYGAKTTPHMFVINPDGVVVYAGAIDDNNSADSKVIAKSKNYVAEVLDASLAGKKVPTTSTPSYGCGIKYKE